jgi:prolyl 4-hydroxylase
MNNDALSLEQQGLAARAAGPDAMVKIANALLAGHGYGTDEHDLGHALLLEAAQRDGGIEAKWLLGAYYLQVSSRPGARDHVARWLQEATRAGMPMAADRLSDLYLRGWGVPCAPGRALALLDALAAQGYARAAWEAGYLRSSWRLGEDGHENHAFARACALGYPFAYYSLGLRFALGAGVRQDAALARALLLRAADAKIPDAAAAAASLAPESVCGAEAAKWYGSLKANLDTAQLLLQQLHPAQLNEAAPLNPRLPAVENHFATLGHPAFKMDGNGRLYVVSDGSASLRANDSAWDWRSDAPRVGIREHFATREECAHLINSITPRLAQPGDYRRPGDNDAGEVSHFNGSGSPIGTLYADPVVRTLERRVAEATQWSLDAIEPSSIIRYQHGQEYRPHVDFFTDGQVERNAIDRQDYGGQRIATFLLYLRAPEEGGETHYHGSGLSVSGSPGMGVIHYNVTPEGQNDLASRHSGRAIVRGEKWVWRSALRANTFDHPADRAPAQDRP